LNKEVFGNIFQSHTQLEEDMENLQTIIIEGKTKDIIAQEKSIESQLSLRAKQEKKL
jgi:hypothetical protein